jgi:hypothetical protein
MDNTTMNHKANHLTDILLHFGLEGTIGHVHPFGSGHINDTFRAENTDVTRPDYILQRINHTIFKNVPSLMQNIKHVTDHVQKKLEMQDIPDRHRKVLTLVPARDGNTYYQDAEGNYWRIFHQIKDTRSYDIVQTPYQAREGGRAFGQFQSWLSDMEPGLLTETIPDFHNIEKRYEKFQNVILADPSGRRKDVPYEIEFVNRRIQDMGEILRNGKEGKLPLRITHNDTKFNNVLLDNNDRALCVIDLDTVMPGYVAYDFGDSVRTIVNTAAEDEKDLAKIEVNMELYEAFAVSFLRETGSSLTRGEIDSLPMGALLLPYMIGLRFLTDYIEGDVYFKTHFPEHNLQRARAQFRLLSRLEDNYNILKDIVLSAAEKFQPQNR